MLCQLSGQELVQLCVEDTVRDELQTHSLCELLQRLRPEGLLETGLLSRLGRSDRHASTTNKHGQSRRRECNALKLEEASYHSRT